MWLKRSTPQNIVIGGAAGALPPMIGWAAVTGRVGAGEPQPVPDHLPVDAAALLGAVALQARGLRQGRRADAAGGRGEASTKRHILAYAVVLAVVASAAAAARRRHRLDLCGDRRRSRRGLRLARLGASTACRDDDAAKLPARRLFTFRSCICSCSSLLSWRRRASPELRHDGHDGGWRRRPAPDRGATEAAPRPRGGDRAWRSAVLVVLFFLLTIVGSARTLSPRRCDDDGRRPIPKPRRRRQPRPHRRGLRRSSSPAWSACPSPPCRSTASSARSPATAAPRAGPGRAQADPRPRRHRPLRQQYRQQSRLELPAGEAPGAGQARRGRHRLLPRREPHGAGPRPAPPRSTSRPIRPAPISTRSPASASPTRR